MATVRTKDHGRRQYRALWPELGPALEHAFPADDDPVLGDAVHYPIPVARRPAFAGRFEGRS